MLNKIKELKEEGKKIIATNGCFDILHVGHLRYLEKSKALGDVLVVGLNSDASVKRLKGESRPVNNQDDRKELLLGLEAVDFVVIFEEDTAVEFLKSVKPDIYTKGGDYSPEELEKWPEYAVAKEIACKIELIDFVDGKSSTNIIEKIG
jgi:rfaE bifunctional protein nucleotidyltransferase chain/domain